MHAFEQPALQAPHVGSTPREVSHPFAASLSQSAHPVTQAPMPQAPVAQLPIAFGGAHGPHVWISQSNDGSLTHTQAPPQSFSWMPQPGGSVDASPPELPAPAVVVAPELPAPSDV
jgi:hypothetical protein